MDGRTCYKGPFPTTVTARPVQAMKLLSATGDTTRVFCLSADVSFLMANGVIVSEPSKIAICRADKPLTYGLTVVSFFTASDFDRSYGWPTMHAGQGPRQQALISTTTQHG